MKLKNFLIYSLGFLFMFVLLFYTFGNTSQGIYTTGVIQSICEIPSIDADSKEKTFAVKILVSAGEYKGQILDAEHFEAQNSAYNMDIATGETVVTVIDKQPEQLIVGIDEHYKSRKLMFLTGFLIIVIVIIAGINGMKAMIALFFTLIIIFGGMANLLLKGYPPILLTIAAAVIIACINLYFIAGKTKKMLVATLGTLSGVFLAGIFGWFATLFLHLSGYTGHESTYLQLMNAKLDLRGILVSGIIIGALGAVMDVAISIASSLHEIIIANPEYTAKKLFVSGMNIGKDIIGSMVNTLILAYTGASLSLILLFSMQRVDFPLIKIMNMEFICSEIIRSLAGLFGMVLAIPITALVASVIYSNKKKQRETEL